jgi:hypothetical protein
MTVKGGKQRIATDAERERALAIYEAEGPSEAARQTGWAKSTITQWAKRRGVATQSPHDLEAVTAARVARHNLSMAEWRERITADLQQISLLAATVEQHYLSQEGQRLPTMEKVTSARVKAVNDLMLLSGEPTSRTAVQKELGPAAAAAARLRDELAERRQAKQEASG